MTAYQHLGRQLPAVVLIILMATGFFGLSKAKAAQLRANPESYRAMLQKLQPGDNLLLEPGLYHQSMPLHGLSGSPLHPIVIRGPAEGPPAVFVGRAGHNTISLSNTAYVEISNLVLDGRNLEVDAVKAEGGNSCTKVHHIALQDLLIVGHGASQDIVGISSMCPAWNWVIRRNVIIGAGTGLYLGGSNGSAPFFASLIEQNIVVDTLGYNLQVKHQIVRPSGIGIPTEPARTIIRHNLFSKANNASQGADARPNVLLGHFPRQDPGSKDVYELTNNVFYCNPVESLLQAEGNLLLTENILINPAGNAVSIQPHNDLPKHIELYRNFIAASGNGATIMKASSAHSQTVSENWVYSPTPLQGGKWTDNRIAPFSASATNFITWAASKHESSPDTKPFLALTQAAGRWCSDPQHKSLQSWPGMYNRLRDNPACNLVKLLESVTATPSKQTAESETPGIAGIERCARNRQP